METGSTRINQHLLNFELFRIVGLDESDDDSVMLHVETPVLVRSVTPAASVPL